jgi:hypothetical protein
MIYKDIDDLNARFWSTSLTYTGPDNTVFEIPDEQKLTENGKLQEVDASEPWVRWTIIRGASERDTLGSNPFFRSIGTATLEIHVPKGIGTGIANEILDSFFAAFRDWRTENGELRVYRTRTDKVSNKDFHQINGVLFYESRRLG